MEVSNRYVTIKHHVDGFPSESDFELKTVSLVLSIEAGFKDVLVKNIYESVDPYQLNRMKESSPSTDPSVTAAPGLLHGQVVGAYGPFLVGRKLPVNAKFSIFFPFQLLGDLPEMMGSTQRFYKTDSVYSFFRPTKQGHGVGRVLESGNPNFEKGDLVVGFIGWEEYSLVRGGGTLRKLQAAELEFPLSYHVGILGLSGLTAYGGFFYVCKPKKGETIFVSAAAGSVGYIVGQYAKLFGCYGVGCAGSKQKVL